MFGTFVELYNLFPWSSFTVNIFHYGRFLGLTLLWICFPCNAKEHEEFAMPVLGSKFVNLALQNSLLKLVE